MIRARAWLAPLLLWSLPLLAAAPIVTVPLAKVLRELSDPRLQFVFSSRLVPDSLRVADTAAELRARGPDVLQTITATLAPLGLGLTRIAPGIYAVVARPSSATIPAPVTPAPIAVDEPLREV